jgi:hypothetical protein
MADYTDAQIAEAELDAQRYRLFTLSVHNIPLNAKHKEKIEKAKLAAEQGETSGLY